MSTCSQHKRVSHSLAEKIHLSGHLGFKVRIHGAFEEISSFVQFPIKSERQFILGSYPSSLSLLESSNPCVGSGLPACYLYLPSLGNI